MPIKYRSKSQQGISIIEVLVAVGLMAIIMTGFSSMLLNQNKETKALGEILAAQDLQKNLTALSASGAVCEYLVKDKIFNASLVVAGTPQEIDIGTTPIYSSMFNSTTPGPALIKKGDKVSVYSQSLEVKSIKLKIETGVVSGTTGSFNAKWIIDFDETKTIRKVKPAIASTVIAADTTTATNAKIVSCAGGSSTGSLTINNTVVVWGPIAQRTTLSVATCPTGYIVVSGGANYQSSCCCGEMFRFVTANRPSADRRSWEGSVECTNHRTVAYCVKENP